MANENKIITVGVLKEYHDNKVASALEKKADLVDNHVKAEQLQLKTINGVSVKGEGDITIDLSLYKMVAALPDILVKENEDDEEATVLNPAINKDKIYLVPASSTGTNNVYVEYLLANAGTAEAPSYVWEKIGEFTAAVDLAPYFKTADITEGNGLALTDDKLTMSVATTSEAGAMSAADKTKLDGIQVATWAELEDALNATPEEPQD